MKINLDEAVMVLIKRAERLRAMNTHMEEDVRINLERVKEALAEVENLLTPKIPKEKK